MKPPAIANVNGLFETSARYKAPVFQRFYVWQAAELDSLWDDIDTADQSPGQFLGAIVLKDLGRPEGPTSPSSYLLIDGQQRLTTFFLLFIALAKTAREHDRTDISEFIAKNYLAETKGSKFNGWPKLVPTLQDRSALWKILSDHVPEVTWNFSADLPEERHNPSDKLTPQWARAVDLCNKTFVDATGAFLAEHFDRFMQSLQEGLRLIVITLDQTDDANLIFSRLNAKGIPLELSDLVRNEVFSKFHADESEKAEKFYYKTWQPFEKSFPDKSLDQFFPIYAQIALKGKITKSSAFTHLQGRWDKHKPQAILADLDRYAPYYKSLFKYNPHPSFGTGLNAAVERISRMPRTTVTWPFLLEVLRATEDSKLTTSQAERIMKVVESFLVRRSIIGIEPTGLHTVFKTLWERTKGDFSEVLGKIVTRTIQVPDDTEITRALLNEPVDSRVILPYIFEEFERYYTKINKYDLAPTAATIEHIAPQHLADGWSEAFSVEEHKKQVGLIGNLTPLSAKQNKSLQDQSWNEKRSRFKGSDFKMTQALADKRVWNPTAVLARTSELSKWIVERWPPLSQL